MEENGRFDSRGAAGDEASSSESSLDEWLLPRPTDTDPSYEHWDLLKLILFVKAGDQTATLTGMCCMLDHDITSEHSQVAIKDSSYLEVLVNLLQTKHEDCLLGALTLLSKISTCPRMKLRITDLNGVPALVRLLQSGFVAVKALAADTLANVADIQKARSDLHNFGGIPLLLDLLDEELRVEEGDRVAAIAAARALHVVSISARCRLAMRRAGLTKLLTRVIRKNVEDVLLHLVGIVDKCSTEYAYQLGFRTERLILDMVYHLGSSCRKLQTLCASVISKLALDPLSRELVLGGGGLTVIANLLLDKAVHADKALLAAVAAAVWSCAKGPKEAAELTKLQVVEALVGLLVELSVHEDVLYTDNNQQLRYIVGALAELCRLEVNGHRVLALRGLPSLVRLLGAIDDVLLQEVAAALGECARILEAMVAIDQLDGVRLLWSLLRNPDPGIQRNATLALCPFIEHLKYSGQVVRSIVGGLDSVVELLGSPDVKVVAAACKAIALIARNPTNLAILSDYGVVALLAQFFGVEDSILRRHLADAIGSCCRSETNCHEFGRLGVIPSLVRYLQDELQVQRAAAGALHQLSADPFNCITMHHHGVVPYLLRTIGSTDRKLQESSAGCLRNIRKLALTADQHKKIKCP